MTLDHLLQRDRRLVACGLALIVAIAWASLLSGAGTGMSALDLTAMSREMRMDQPTWTLGYAAVMFAMWWIMMVAMMLPSVTPVLLLAAALNRKARPGRNPFGAVACFAFGYLGVWAFFGLLAVAAQWSLTQAGLFSAMMHVTSEKVAGALLIAAGAWQFTSIKRACLRGCRSPARLLASRRRRDNFGAIVMGVEHGAYCVGCCWSLMALLFVGGVMNLYWIASLAAFVLVEKLLRWGEQISRWMGAAFIICGAALIGGLP